MPREVQALLSLRPGDLAVDVTVGAGGHAEQMLACLGPGGHLVALDVDPEALALAEARLRPLSIKHKVRFDIVKGNYRNLCSLLPPLAAGEAPRAVLADLGVSSMQFDNPMRGFSFRHDAALDLRMDPDLPRTGADLLRELPEQELADILYYLGGERGARAIARRVVAARERGQPILTTGQFELLVRQALHVRGHQRIHPATRAFQGVRMAVNEETRSLQEFLATAPELLAPGGVLAVIAFHSGEDRLVKQAFKEWASTGRFQIVAKHVIRPEAGERQANPRSRSARLRGLRRS